MAAAKVDHKAQMEREITDRKKLIKQLARTFQITDKDLAGAVLSRPTAGPGWALSTPKGLRGARGEVSAAFR